MLITFCSRFGLVPVEKTLHIMLETRSWVVEATLRVVEAANG